MKISVVTINYNNQRGLSKTIKSVLNQTYKDYEYIIIDGGSTDGSAELIKSYTNDLTYWVSEPDNGIYHAMNKGIAKATGEYVIFMNSGDCFYNDTVLIEASPLLCADICAGSFIQDDRQDHVFHSPNEITLWQFYNGTLVTSHQAMFTRLQLLKDEPFSEALRLLADWKFNLSQLILHNRSYQSLPIIVANTESVGRSNTNKAQCQKEREIVINELSSILPPRVLMDYDYLKDKKSIVLDLIPQFYKTYRLELFIYHAVKAILTIYKFIYRKKYKTHCALYPQTHGERAIKEQLAECKN